MNIAIFGTGNIGGGLAFALAGSAHGVILAARDAAQAKARAEEISRDSGHNVQGASLAEAAKVADVILLAVPYAAAGDALAQAGDLSGKVVIDVTNPLTDDFTGLTVGHTSSAAEEIQMLIPNTPVVKALNTVFAQIYREGTEIGGRKVPAYYAGDNAEAKAIAAEVISAAGLDAVDAGGLASARFLEPLAALNIQFGYMLGHGTGIAPAWLNRAA
jgi:hypothetical protein